VGWGELVYGAVAAEARVGRRIWAGRAAAEARRRRSAAGFGKHRAVRL
jgi:hypothetical protein